MIRIWLIEDDSMYASMLKHQIEKNENYSVEVFPKADEIVKGELELPDAIFLDYQLPGITGEKVLEYIKSEDSNLPVIMVSGQEDPTIAAELIKKGAHDYLTKTPDTPRLLASILAKLERQLTVKKELEILRSELRSKYDFAKTLGSSSAITKLFPVLTKAVKSLINISLAGDSGVGKETVARTIHYNSSRSSESFVTTHLGTIAREGFEDELSKMFDKADGGTLFLDEIAEINGHDQAKLLTAIQKGTFVSKDSGESKKINCRLITSTNKDLKELVRLGAFREDLYYLLVGMPIIIPSLKDRRADILLLAAKFKKSFCRKNEMDVLRFDKAAQEKLLHYNWPGNVRELKAIVELACTMADEEYINEEDIRFEETSPNQDLLSKERSLKEYDAMIVEYFLNKYESDIPRVANILDIGKSTIYRMIKNNEIKNPKA
jgi:two-component system response regulator AtoC